jgi:hypothetical protein
MLTSTLRPGLLVSLKTSIAGNVNYRTLTLESDHITETGARQARWETERTVVDPQEHEAAIKARSLARSKIQCVCANSAFGLLCPESKAAELEAAVVEARAIVDAFNRSAGLTRLSFNLIAGKGLANLDVSKVRDAANKARSVGAMLTDDAKERVQAAIEVARKTARAIVSAGEEGAVEVDRVAIRKVLDARTSFLDLDDAGEVAAVQPTARPVDFESDGFEADESEAYPGQNAWKREQEQAVQVRASTRIIDLED